MVELDPVTRTFFERQLVEVRQLVAESDVLSVVPEPGDAPLRYRARFDCRTLVRSPMGEVVEARGVEVGIVLPTHYVRHVDPRRLVSWLAPWNSFHPNVRAPSVCLGHLGPRTPLVDVLAQCYAIATWQKYATDDAFDPVACQWARNNSARLPLERRGLRRRVLQLRTRAL